jgi:YHS domain-containing protein
VFQGDHRLDGRNIPHVCNSAASHVVVETSALIRAGKTMTIKQAFIRLTAAVALVTSVVPAAPALAAGTEVNVTITGLALRGYDPVAYFTDGKPVIGDYTITTQYDGATYRFASEDHKALFLTDPARYLPEYGGFCAYGTAKGVKVDGDPTVWKIVDNKLYLNLAPAVATRWDQDIPGNIKTADEKWKAVKDKAPSELLK